MAVKCVLVWVNFGFSALHSAPKHTHTVPQHNKSKKNSESRIKHCPVSKPSLIIGVWDRNAVMSYLSG